MKLIKLSDTHYIICDDYEIKDGDFVTNGVEVFLRESMPEYSDEYANRYWQKITHSTQPLEDIGLNTSMGNQLGFAYIQPLLLSEVEEAINGYDLIALSIDATSKNKFANGRHEEIVAQIYYRRGFKAHQELVKDKLFTLADILDAIYLAINEPNAIDKIIQSLLPKKEWEIELDQYGKIKILNT